MEVSKVGLLGAHKMPYFIACTFGLNLGLKIILTL
jgi:hypothetical protein